MDNCCHAPWLLLRVHWQRTARARTRCGALLPVCCRLCVRARGAMNWAWRFVARSTALTQHACVVAWLRLPLPRALFMAAAVFAVHVYGGR